MQFQPPVVGAGAVLQWGPKPASDNASSLCGVGGLETLSISALAGGLSFSMALSTSGQICAWGKGTCDVTVSYQPCRVDAIAYKYVMQVACGDNHAMALCDDHDVYSWGSNKSGQLGFAPEEVDHISMSEPRHVHTLRTVKIQQIACGQDHSLALDDNDMYSWGSGKNGRLGLGHEKDVFSPTKTPEFTSLRLIAISAGWRHSVALAENGSVFTWGSGLQGQLGHSDNASKQVPTELCVVWQSRVYQVRAAGNHTLALTAGGQVYAWGWGGDGRLGLGDTAQRFTPCQIESLRNIVDIMAGSKHSLALSGSGDVWGWGSGAAGQLGYPAQSANGAAKCLPRPKKILQNVTRLASAGSDHSIFVMPGQ